MAHRVFISYSTKDVEQANAVVSAFEAAGIECWIAPRDIRHGESWASAIVSAINDSETVVLLLSANSNASQDVGREINRATSRKIRILTVRLEDIQPTGDLEYYLSNSQWFDAFERPFAEYLELLLIAVQTPAGLAAGTRNIAQGPHADPEAIENALREIDWRLAELQHYEGPLRCSPLDSVLEAAIEVTHSLHAARQWDACLRIYHAAAAGVLAKLESVPPVDQMQWPAEIEPLMESLRGALAAEQKNQLEPEAAMTALHRIFVDFLDRTPPEQTSRSRQWLMGMAALGLLLVSAISLALAYHPSQTTTTWEVHYAYAYGPKFGRLGPYLEFSRSLLLLIVCIYLFEALFREEFGRLLLDWKPLSWRRPNVAIGRGVGLIVGCFVFWTVYDHVLVGSPSGESVWARDYLANPHRAKELDRFDAEIRGVREELAKEAALGADYHRRPFQWYLPYCLVNYNVYGALVVTLCFFAIVSDRRRLWEERAALNAVLVNQRLPDADVDREFARFFKLCFRHSQRYINLLLWLSILILYESIVTKPTLSDQGWRYELLTSAVVGLSALFWIGILSHFYEGAFQRACDEKRRRRRLTSQWERSWSTTSFLSRAFLNLRSGVALLIYFIPVALVFWEVSRR